MTERLRLLLKPAALLYRGVVQLRNLGFENRLLQSWRAPLPVVSIGNITAGGTGKTPLADWIIKYLLSKGERPALISRGYRRSTKGVVLVSDGRTVLCSSREAGDETAMLASKNRGIIVVAAERRKDGVAYIMDRFRERLPSVIVLDDAFQHRQIARDLDIVVVSAAEPYFDAAMLPEGRLREPLANIRRADLAVVSKVTDRGTAIAIAENLKRQGLPVVLARTAAGTLVPFGSAVKPAPAEPEPGVLAFAGIGAPAGFVGSLEEKGFRVEAHRFFRDHEPYTREKLIPLLDEARCRNLIPVTTEKDYYRLLDETGLPELCGAAGACWLRIETEFIEGQALLEHLLLETVSR
jgi:tetraacyldisaccharide 4'-kinase